VFKEFGTMLLRQSVIVLISCTWFALVSIPAVAQERQDPFVYPSLAEDRAPSEQAAVQSIREAAVTLAVQDFLGPLTGRIVDEQFEGRFLLAAKARTESLVELSFTRRPMRHELTGAWMASATATVDRAQLASIARELKTGGSDCGVAPPPLRFMVLISERIEYVNVPGPIPVRDDEIGSLINQAVKSRLAELGYEPVNTAQHEFLKQGRLDFSDLRKEDHEQIMAIAQEQGADVLILGRADVSGPRVRELSGRPWYFWQTIPEIEILWQDTGVTIKASDERTEGGSDIKGPPGARTALLNAGKLIADRLAKDLARRPADGGPRPLDVRINDIATQDVTTIRALISRFGNATEPRISGGVMTFRLATDRNAIDVAAELEQLALPTGSTLILDALTPRTVTMRVKK
jgi:hypothetical protein